MPDGVAWPRPTPQPRSSSPRHVRHRRRRRAMGRRGEGPGRRLPGRRCGPRHPLRRWQQRRPHGGQPARPLQAPPDPVGDLLAADAQPARQRRGHQPAGAGRPSSTGSRRPASAARTCSSAIARTWSCRTTCCSTGSRSGSAGPAKLGTTSRGIGPAYVDKVARRGIRIVDLMEPAQFRERLEAALPRISRIVAGYRRRSRDRRARLPRPPMPRRSPTRTSPPGTACAPRRRRPGGGRRGARGRRADPARGPARHDARHRLGHLSLRDELEPDPRRREPGGGAAGRADRPRARRGEGVHHRGRRRARCRPSWTDAEGDELRERGAEYGTSTGRARRCGWYDAVAVRFSVRLAGYSSIALTKLDVLDGYPSIKLGSRLPRSDRRPGVDDRAGVDIGL